ncbi:lipopolysaccharide biosynthesis glycosyltransferase [Gracilibacillus halotolerans]|uniref:Lipopolysaccharide biosynthesis glycosyltransferase n=1 Tax=Gracilibacillus halotolerans TaxID=74386 RepID=A0A841RHP7_9BACI|nr:glycosyltransferase family 8 protein [Gracilibacillus halotolerans]MBB6512009.1 lipopolysaccharide biosynthesis glycosyltransferase [Gracilibacillus halotolerans]
MNILVTLNANYIKPLKVMLQSLFLNNPKEEFTIYLMHSSLTFEEVTELKSFVRQQSHELNDILIDSDIFVKAPIIKHFSIEMYYRLLAYKFLPAHLERILYLDPDILVINELSDLYNEDLEGYLYAAAYHDFASVKEINKLRWRKYDIEAYYNSGVLLMNLEEQRKRIKEEDIFQFVEENRKKLILPDQDIINGLYSKFIKNINEIQYNFDARSYYYYRWMSKNTIDLDYVMNHTAIIHFCGKKKPWHPNYKGKFHSLYKHYERLTKKYHINVISELG